MCFFKCKLNRLRVLMTLKSKRIHVAVRTQTNIYNEERDLVFNSVGVRERIEHT